MPTRGSLELSLVLRRLKGSKAGLRHPCENVDLIPAVV
jgi:hypothetical protein